MRYLVSCERTIDGEVMADYVSSRAEAADSVVAVCLMHKMMGGDVSLLTEDASDPELHVDLYMNDERVGHLSAIPVDGTLN